MIHIISQGQTAFLQSADDKLAVVVGYDGNRFFMQAAIPVKLFKAVEEKAVV